MVGTHNGHEPPPQSTSVSVLSCTLFSQPSIVGIGVGLVLGLGVGAAVGASVGTGVGDALGACVGACVGDVLGACVGADVGANEGEALGSAVGTLVGPAVGLVLGLWLGAAVGASVGSAVGSSVGDCDGALVVGNAVGCAVGWPHRLFQRQWPLSQSRDDSHRRPDEHAGQLPPPQSIAVSSPFRMSSTQSGFSSTVHRPASQLSLLQSRPRRHFLPGWHAGHSPPPQSTLVSSPLKMSS